MIIAKAPYRVSFFGGGSDYPEWYKKFGGSFLSASLNHYICIFVRRVPDFRKEKRFRILWKIIEEESEINKIRNPIVRECLRMLNINFSLDIGYFGDLPSNSGMGSSSTFTVALLGALYQLLGLEKSKVDIVKDAIKIERKILKEIVGIQDQINAAFGGFNFVDIEKNGNFKVQEVNISTEKLKKFSSRLLLVYTGISRHASKVAKDQVKNFEKKSINIDRLQQMSKEGRDILEKNRDLDEFGVLLNEGWMRKKDISKNISNKTIDDIYQLGIKNGALGGKLLGAGSGGFVLFFSKEDKLNILKNAFRDFSFLPLNIGQSGLVINTEQNTSSYNVFQRNIWTNNNDEG